MRKFVTFVALFLVVCTGVAYASIGWAGNIWPCQYVSYADNQNIGVYVQVWKGGCTDMPGPCADVLATLNYKRASEGSWHQAVATFNTDIGSNDEWVATIPSAATEAGDPMQYYYDVLDLSDNTPYAGPICTQCECNPPYAVNITPATEQAVTVVFRVDMACLEFDLFSAGVFVAGDFQGWSQCTTVLSDPDGDEIYEGSWTFPAGSNPSIQFKFNRAGTDGCQWENAIGNRTFTIDDSQPVNILPVETWDNWDCCTPTGPAEITGPGSWCVTICPCDEFLMIPLNTSFNPPIIHAIEFTPGCNTDACGPTECTPGTGSPEWDVYRNELGYWLVVTCVPRNWHAHWGCFCMTIDQILPVEFGDFEAVAGDREVTLNWNTRSETNNARFDVERDGQVVAQVPSQGDASGHDYSWIDRDVTNGRAYSYSLVAVDVSGSRVTVATESVTPHSTLITEYALSANYPNPFNPTTSFSYSLKDAGFVSLKVYDVAGRLVNELVSSEQAVGTYTVAFDGANLPSGIYYYRLNVNAFSATQKMVLMK